MPMEEVTREEGRGIDRDVRSDSNLRGDELRGADPDGRGGRAVAPLEDRRVRHAEVREGRGNAASETVSRGEGVARDVEASSRGQVGRSGGGAGDPPSQRRIASELAARVRWNAVSRGQTTKWVRLSLSPRHNSKG